MSVNTYTTIQGDMWDSIAHKVMGSSDYTGELMKKNRRYLGIYIFPAGIKLEIPAVPTVVKDALPPWKRGVG